MITALNPATIGGAPPLREYVALAEKYGFGGIEFNIDEAIQMADETSWANVIALFEQYGVAPAVFGMPVDWRGDEDTFNTGLSALPAKARAARTIGCTRTGTWLPPAINDSTDVFGKLMRTRFLAIANVLADFDIRFGLEFVAPQTLRSGPGAMGKHPFIYSMQQTLDVIEQLDAPADNIGLLLDSFHWFTSGGTVGNLVMLSASQIVHVHINDAPDVPLAEQIDGQRLLPGDGVIDLAGFLKTLAGIGYSGFVAVETFNKQLISLGPDQAAARTEAALEKLLATL